MPPVQLEMGLTLLFHVNDASAHRGERRSRYLEALGRGNLCEDAKNSTDDENVPEEEEDSARRFFLCKTISGTVHVSWLRWWSGSHLRVYRLSQHCTALDKIPNTQHNHTNTNTNTTLVPRRMSPDLTMLRGIARCGRTRGAVRCPSGAAFGEKGQCGGTGASFDARAPWRQRIQQMTEFMQRREVEDGFHQLVNSSWGIGEELNWKVLKNSLSGFPIGLCWINWKFPSILPLWRN